MQRRINVRAVIAHDGKLLCVRHKDYDTGEVQDFLAVPGGGVEEGEPLLDAVRREMVEETGVAPKIGNLLFVQQFAEPEKHKEFLEFFFHVTNAEDYAVIDLAATTHGDGEIAEIGFFNPTENYILPKFLSTENLEELIAAGPTKIISEELIKNN